MAKTRDIKSFIRSIPTASTPDARWGMVGVVLGILLFALPLAIYFFEKGGILMFPSWVWNVLGGITIVIWLVTAIGFGIIFWKWWKATDYKDVITATDIQALIKNNQELIDEIRNDRNEHPKIPK